MKEHPILFNTEMVRAVLDGRKTQTRRVIKHQPPDSRYQMTTLISTTGDRRNEGKHHWARVDGCKMIDGEQPYFACPYGQVGDQLWVREKFCIGSIVAGDHHPEESEPLYIEQCKGQENAIPYEYATREDIGIEDVKWKPSIFMRREYSRINLEITDIRVERVQDITEEDSLKEGIKIDGTSSMGHVFTGKEHFWGLWDSINEKRGFGWDVNPWVWVVEFKLIKTERGVM